MGRHNGSWSPVYGQAWTHHKTARASAWLVEHGRRIAAAVAPFLVLGWLNRLNVWCLDNHSHGSLHALTVARVGTLAWPEAVEGGMAAAKAGETVLGALRAGGFLEGDDPTIHEFEQFHAAILEKRRPNLDAAHQREAGRRSAEARRARDGTAQPNRPPNRDGSTAPNREPEPSSEPSPEPSYRTVPDRTGPESERARTGTVLDPERGFATTADSPRLDAASLAHDLELRIGCSYAQADKAVRVVIAAGAEPSWVRARILATRPPAKPWEWQDAACRAIAPAAPASSFFAPTESA